MHQWQFEYNIDVDVDNHLMYEKIYGVWRRATAEQYVADFIEEAAPLIDKPWAKMCDLTQWKTAAPEVIDIIGKHLIWCRQNNLALSVDVIDNPITYAQLQRMFDKGGVHHLVKVFRTRSEGEKYLASQGYKVNVPKGNGPF